MWADAMRNSTRDKAAAGLGASSWRDGGMTDDELVAALCLRIGMMMEDVCADAVTVGPDDRNHLVTVVRTLSGAAKHIDALIRTASVLLDGAIDAPGAS